MLEELKRKLEDSKKKQQDAAAMHATGKYSYWSGRADAYNHVISMLTGRPETEER